MHAMPIERTIEEAAEVIRSGGIVAYPTEAVWGLGCDPFDEGAVHRLLAIKQRPVEKGLILIAATLEQLRPLIDVAAVPTDRLADVRRMMAGEGTMPTKVTPAMLDGLTHQELRALREVIDRKLPDNSLDELNLEKELVSQYHKTKLLMDEVLHDDDTPANQRAQVANSVVSTLAQLVKLQEDLRREESLKLAESVFIEVIATQPIEIKDAFFDEYEKRASIRGLTK